ncbi:MAG: TIM barrel protein [Candidatus Nanoarchaeia archaeon]
MIDFSKIKVSNPDKLRFGTAGIPISAQGLKTWQGVEVVRKLGLENMELEFVHNVNLTEQTAELTREARDKNNVTLTAHGSYYINLNAAEKEKIGASRTRILQAANICRQAGGWSITFHAAYYLKNEQSAVYNQVREQLQKITNELEERGNSIWIRPETTGKATQFGDMKEIIALSNENEQVLPCVDFAHLHARTGGKNNTTEEFRELLSMIEKGLGRRGLDNMHIHMSGIEYSAKGERNHLFLEDSDFKWRELLKVWKEFKIKGVVVCESPNIEQDALLMKKYYEALK